MSDANESRPASIHSNRGRGPTNGLLQVLAFGAVYLIWGSTYLAIRIAVATLPPLLMAGSRFLAAGIVLYAALRALGVRAPSASEWRHAAVAGALLLGLGNGLVSWAEQSVPSNQAALMIAGVPLYVVLLDWWRPGGQRPTKLLFAGIGLGFIGMLLLVLPSGSAVSLGAVGAGLLLLAGVCWAAGTLFARYGKRHPHPVMSAAAQMLAGGVLLLAAGLAHGDAMGLRLSAISRESALALGYLVVFGSLVAFSAYGWLVVVSTPSLLSTTAYVNPVIAVVLGWLVLGEALTPRALAGGALILGAVLLMTLGARPPPRVPTLGEPTTAGARAGAPRSTPRQLA